MKQNNTASVVPITSMRTLAKSSAFVVLASMASILVAANQDAPANLSTIKG